MQTYKDLKAWQANQECILDGSLLIESLPNTIPARVLSDQLFRSLASVGANIAEGYGSFEGREYPRYCKVAMRSAIEADHWLCTMRKLFENLSEDIGKIESRNTEVIKMLIGLIRSIEDKRSAE